MQPRRVSRRQKAARALAARMGLTDAKQNRETAVALDAMQGIRTDATRR